MQRNLTVRLEDDTIHKARILAAKRATSISKLVAGEIDRLVREDEAYEQARVEALADLESGFDLGSEGRLPPREAAHER
jgi:hypothetical protein